MVPVPRELGMNINRVEYIAHEPVMAKEVLKLLENINEGTFIDATYGDGSHFELIRAKFPKLNIFGIEKSLFFNLFKR